MVDHEFGVAGTISGRTTAIHEVRAECAHASCQARFKVVLSSGCFNAQSPETAVQSFSHL